MDVFCSLLSAEGLAIGALIHGGVLLVSTYQDALQGAVIGFVAMVDTLLYSAFDAFIGMAVHMLSSFLRLRLYYAPQWALSCIQFLPVLSGIGQYLLAFPTGL